MKLFVYETVKCEVINVKFLSKYLPLNNSVIMVKWKCLKSLYSSKGMCRIDSQIKNIDTFEIFNSWNTLYLLLYIQLVFYSFTQTSYHLCFQLLTKTTFPFLVFPTFPFLFVFTTLKKKTFISKYFSHWFNTVPSQSTLISWEVFCDYQINLGNTTNLNRGL